MKLSLLILICLINHSILGQNTVNGIIKNVQTNEPIPYVNIGILNKGIGTVSNEKGGFTLEIPNIYINDTIKISSIGYETKIFIANEFIKILKENQNITLSEKVIQLDEVVVSNKKLKEKVLGNKTKSRMMRGGFKNAPLGHELGIRIKIKKSPTYIEKFHTNITSNTGKSMKFRLNFYNIKDGLPNEKIVYENIIFEIDKKEGEFTLDISEYNIIVEEDFYLSVELIENQKEGEEIFFSAALFGNPIVMRKTSQGNWEKVGMIGIGFNLSVKY